MSPLFVVLAGLVFGTLLSLAWRLRREQRGRLRSAASTAGILGVTISVLGLLTMLTHAIVIARQTGDSAFVLGYYSWTGSLAPVGFVCSLWNSGASRLLACIAGFVATLLWYQVFLAV